MRFHRREDAPYPRSESRLRAATTQRRVISQCHFELRNVLCRNFRLDEALAETTGTVWLNPSSARFRNGASHLHFDRGEYYDGYNAILDARARDAEHPEFHPTCSDG